MKIIVAAAIAAGLATGAAAQMSSQTSSSTTTTAPSATNDRTSHTPALKDSHVKSTIKPANGANSFTQAQARKRIAKAGYTQVGALTKDQDGVWMGTAMQNGKSVTVGLDYKGNVTTR